jgi:uncharacterized protein
MGDTIFLMKKYYLCLLRRSPNRSNANNAAALSLERAHLDHLNWLSENRKICFSGPIASDNELKDVIVFNTPTFEEAERLTRMDPAVKAGRITYEILAWWGPIGGKLF